MAGIPSPVGVPDFVKVIVCEYVERHRVIQHRRFINHLLPTAAAPQCQCTCSVCSTRRETSRGSKANVSVSQHERPGRGPWVFLARVETPRLKQRRAQMEIQIFCIETLIQILFYFHLYCRKEHAAGLFVAVLKFVINKIEG